MTGRHYTSLSPYGHTYFPQRIKDHAASVVSDEAFENRHSEFPVDTPDTKEGYFIREVFQGQPNHLFALISIRLPLTIQNPQACSRLLQQPRQLSAGSHAATGAAQPIPADAVSASTMQHI